MRLDVGDLPSEPAFTMIFPSAAGADRRHVGQLG